MVTQAITDKALSLVDDARRRRPELTDSAISTHSGIPRTTLKRKLDGHEEFKLTELARISEALGANYSKWLRELAKAAS